MKILLLRRENVCYGSLDCFLEGLREGLVSCGVSAEVLDVSSDPTVVPDNSTLLKIKDEGYDAAIAFNAVGQQNYSFEGANFWDKIGIPFFNYIVDHPLSHSKAMLEHGRDYCVICVDGKHVDYIRKYYSGIKDVFFLPVGCDESIYNAGAEQVFEEYENRDIDILFTGTYIPLSSVESRIKEYPVHVKNLIVKHIEYMLDHRYLTEEEGLIRILRDMGIEPEEIDLAGYLFATKLTEEYVKSYLREEIIRYLIDSGINLRIYGNNWDAFEADMRNTVCYPGVDYCDLKKLYLKSRIVLDHSSHFKFGMHDRIPSAMLAGAAVLTDGNDYLKSVTKEGLNDGELCMYDVSVPGVVPNIVLDMLSDIHRLYEMTLRAHSKALKDFTWKSRANELINILNRKGIIT